MIPPTVWANMAPSYSVQVPSGREPLYEWAAPVFLVLATAAGVVWLVRCRTMRTGRARALVWTAAGCLVVSYSAWWVWEHRDDTVHNPGWAAWAAVWMPCLWPAACLFVISIAWKRIYSMEPSRVSSEVAPSPTVSGTDRVESGGV
jgi:hypothetical protein